MRLSRRELIEAYRAAPDSPLRQHIDALEDELRILSGVTDAWKAMAEKWETVASRLREVNPKNPIPVIVVKEDESEPRRLGALRPLSLTAEEILQYAVEVELFDS